MIFLGILSLVVSGGSLLAGVLLAQQSENEAFSDLLLILCGVVSLLTGAALVLR